MSFKNPNKLKKNKPKGIVRAESAKKAAPKRAMAKDSKSKKS